MLSLRSFAASSAVILATGLSIAPAQAAATCNGLAVTVNLIADPFAVAMEVTT